MKLLDANLILRFLLKDDLRQFQKAKSILENPEEDLYLADMAVAEVIWVLTSFYKFKREDVAEKIYNLLNLNPIYSSKNLLVRALYFYRDFNIDFIDAYLAAYCEQEKLEGIYSFDEGLDKIKSIKRFKP